MIHFVSFRGPKGGINEESCICLEAEAHREGAITLKPNAVLAGSRHKVLISLRPLRAVFLAVPFAVLAVLYFMT